MQQIFIGQGSNSLYFALDTTFVSQRSWSSFDGEVDLGPQEIIYVLSTF